MEASGGGKGDIHVCLVAKLAKGADAQGKVFG